MNDQTKTVRNSGLETYANRQPPAACAQRSSSPSLQAPLGLSVSSEAYESLRRTMNACESMISNLVENATRLNARVNELEKGARRETPIDERPDGVAQARAIVENANDSGTLPVDTFAYLFRVVEEQLLLHGSGKNARRQQLVRYLAREINLGEGFSPRSPQILIHMLKTLGLPADMSQYIIAYYDDSHAYFATVDSDGVASPAPFNVRIMASSILTTPITAFLHDPANRQVRNAVMLIDREGNITAQFSQNTGLSIDLVCNSLEEP